MASNPEALEDQRKVPLTGGEEKYDVEAYPPGAEAGYAQTAAAATTTTTTTASAPTGGTYTAPTVGVTVKRDVRPSPRHGYPGDQNVQKETTGSGGVLSAFKSKSTGRFFFALHAAIVLFSFLVLVSAALIADRAVGGGVGALRFVQYELVIGQISFAVSLGALVMERLGLLEHRPIRVALSAFQVFLWVPALVIFTFFGTFRSPLESANGYFGTWGALTAAVVVFMHESERSRTDPRASAAPRSSLLLMFFFSLMIMGSGIIVFEQYNSTPGGFNNPNDPRNYVIWAIAFGAATAFFSLIFLLFLDTTPVKTLMFLGTIFWVWVAVGASFLTFGNPFETALGNGYYSTFFTLLASFGLLMSLRRESRDSDRANTAANAASGDPNRRTTHDETESSASFFLHMRIVTFSSLAVMIAAILICRNSDGCENNYQRYEVAAGVVPLGLCLVVVLLEGFGLYRIAGGFKIGFALLILLWWIAAFTVLTFFGSFQSPVAAQPTWYANGFFFSWIALIFSCLAFAAAMKESAMKSDPPNPVTAKSGFLFLIILGSVIELGAGIQAYYANKSFNLSVYAISLGAISIFMVLVLYGVMACTRKNYDTHDSLYNGLLYILTLWWAIGTMILTFMSFWNSAVDNGFFSTYFTTGACLLALSGIWRDEYDD
jgi:hypothetical protein